MQSSSPTARRWELAARLRYLRTQAGRSVEEAARELMCSPAKISRLETAGRGVHARDVRDLCRLYSTTDDVRDELMLLALEAKKPGWWHAFRSLNEQVATFIGLESAAAAVMDFETLRIPGALQTPEYTTALLSALHPGKGGDPTWLRENVEARAIRQRRYHHGEVSLHAIIDEAALRRPIGGPDVMAGQIERLMRDGQRPSVSIQVIPYAVGAHPGLHGGAFCLMSFKNDFLPDVVYVEDLPTDFLFGKPEDTARYAGLFANLGREYALSAADSLDMLREMQSSYRTRHRMLRQTEGGRL